MRCTKMSYGHAHLYNQEGCTTFDIPHLIRLAAMLPAPSCPQGFNFRPSCLSGQEPFLGGGQIIYLRAIYLRLVLPQMNAKEGLSCFPHARTKQCPAPEFKQLPLRHSRSPSSNSFTFFVQTHEWIQTAHLFSCQLVRPQSGDCRFRISCTVSSSPPLLVLHSICFQMPTRKPFFHFLR